MLSDIRQRLSAAASTVGVLVLIMLGIQLVNSLTGQSLNNLFGLRSHALSSLWNILTFSWFHASWPHLIGNAVPFFVLGVMVHLSGRATFITATLGSMLGSGVLIWLISFQSITVGASGLVFGFFGFLVVRGIANRSFSSLLVAVVVVGAYGYLIWGTLPTVGRSVSWQGHLGGLIGGALTAYLMRPKSDDAPTSEVLA